MASQGVDRQFALRKNDSTDSRRSSVSDLLTDANDLNPFEDPAPPSPIDDQDGHWEATHRATDPSHRPLSIQPSLQLRPDSLQRRSLSQRYSRQSSQSSRREASTTRFPSPQPNDTANRSSLHAASIPRRMMSNTSTITMPRPASPYRGTNGPSHPYAMHPQDVGVGRTSSNATSTTTGRSYNGPLRPTHAYGIYAQDTTSDDDLGAEATATPMVHLGFNARGNNRYQRTLGPEGEDADEFIGPEGYTEQLPPYTRYANNLPPKDSPVESPPSATTQRNPFNDSQVALNIIPTQQTQDENFIPSAGPPVQAGAANRDSTPADAGGHFKESFTRKSKKLICGVIPLWLLVVIVLAVLVAVIGGFAGAIVHRQHTHPPPDRGPRPNNTGFAAATVTVTSMIDAAPLTATPSNLPPLPTGSFVVSLQNSTGLSTFNDSCLITSNQKNAWACMDQGAINLDLMLLSSEQPQAQINTNLPADGKILYGAQPAQIPHRANLVLMKDKEDLQRGPAYFFQELYNKVVVLREHELDNDDMDGDIRDWPDDHGPDDVGDVALPSHRPWFCYWNNTVMEGFIYITEPANDPDSSQSAGAAVSTSNAAALSSGALASSAPSIANATNTGDPVTASETGSPHQRRQATGLPFPSVLKLEERRGPRRLASWCEQKQILDDGAVSSLTNTDGTPVRINLNEQEPVSQKGVSWPDSPPQQRRRSEVEKRQRHRAGAFLASSCQCQWVKE